MASLSGVFCYYGSMQYAEIAGTYRHYKGNEYTVLAVGTHTESGEKMVVYRALYEPFEVWVRPFDMFMKTVEIEGRQCPRFERIGEV